MSNLASRTVVARSTPPFAVPKRASVAEIGAPCLIQTLTESFNTSDGTTIGPDLTWSKFSFDTGTDDGVIHSNQFSIQNAYGNDFGECYIVAAENVYDPDTCPRGGLYAQAVVAAYAPLGSGSGTETSQLFGVGINGFWFVVGHGSELAWIITGSPGGGVQASAGITFTSLVPPGAVLRIEADATSIRGLVDGSTIVTWVHDGTGWGGGGIYLEGSANPIPPHTSWDTDFVDRMDTFEMGPL